MHAYTHTCMHTYMYAYIHTYIHTHMYTYIVSRLLLFQGIAEEGSRDRRDVWLFAGHHVFRVRRRLQLRRISGQNRGNEFPRCLQVNFVTMIPEMFQMLTPSFQMNLINTLEQ